MTAARPLGTTFRAVVETVVPESASLAVDAWRDVERLAVAAVAQRPARQQRQLRLFLRVVSVLALTRHGHGFAALDSRRRQRLLAGLAASRWALVRRGTWGVRTLALMGYYGRPAAAAEIGYHASPRGWAARTQASRPGAP